MIKKALKRVFGKRAYRILASGIAFSVLIIFLYTPNLTLIGQVFSTQEVSLGYKVSFLFSLAGSFYTNNTITSASILLLVSVLMGINISMLVYMMRKNRDALNKKESTTTIGGVVGGALGIGCAACGSLILTPLIAAIGATGFLSLLPLRGAEFGIAGLTLLLISIKMLANKINDPLICPID